MKIFVSKGLNKVIIGTIIGTAILGLGGYGMSPKGRGFFSRLKNYLKNFFNFFKLGINEFSDFLKFKRK